MQTKFKTAPEYQDLQNLLDNIQNNINMVETAAKEKSNAIDISSETPLFYEIDYGVYNTVQNFGILTTEDCKTLVGLNNQIVKALSEKNYSLVLDTCQAVKGIYLSRSFKV